MWTALSSDVLTNNNMSNTPYFMHNFVATVYFIVAIIIIFVMQLAIFNEICDLPETLEISYK